MTAICPSRFVRFAAGAALLGMSSSAALAAKTGSTRISGTLSGKCKVEFLCPGSATCTSIKFSAKPTGSTNTPNDSTGDIRWSCNLPGQAVSVTFTSLNNGVLKSTSATLPYHVGFQGVNATSFANKYLKPSYSTTGTSAAALTQYSGRLTLTTEPGPNVQAGEYTDMITVTITPSGL